MQVAKNFIQQARCLETPQVLVLDSILEKNISHMQSIANAHAVQLRPHVKTHKSIGIAKRQTQHGACGVTCSKSEEAQVFLEAGLNVLVAYPNIDWRKLRRFEKFGREQFTLTVDSMSGISVIQNFFRNEESKVNVAVKVDTGLHRCGVQIGKSSGMKDLKQLAKKIGLSENLNFVGLVSHAGHAYTARDASECVALANNETALLRKAKTEIHNLGMNCKVSVGCTLTELVRTDFTGIDEIRPGNYVFMDQTAWKKGLIQSSQISLRVLATVVSQNDDFIIVDCGSKTLSNDGGAHGMHASAFGLAKLVSNIFPVNFDVEQQETLQVVKLSEEHGWIKRPSRDLEIRIGDLVEIIPNHSCSVVNLSDEICLLKEDETIDFVQVNARGKCR